MGYTLRPFPKVAEHRRTPKNADPAGPSSTVGRQGHGCSVGSVDDRVFDVDLLASRGGGF